MAQISTHELQNYLSNVTYKPGWELKIYDGAWEGQHLVIKTNVENSYHPGETVELDVHTFMPPMSTFDDFNRYLGWRLARIEVHEMREWLKFAGTPIFNPHAPGADRDLY